MAEAAAAIGLIASIASLIEFGSRVVGRLNEIGGKGHDLPESFRAIHQRVPLLNRTLSKIQERVKAGLVEDGDAKALTPVVDNTLQCIKSLNEILIKDLPSAKASSWEKSIKTLKSLAHDEKVERLLEKVESNIQLLVFAQTTSQVDVQKGLLDLIVKLSDSVAISTTAPQTKIGISQQVHLKQYNFGLFLGKAPVIDSDAFIGRDDELQQLEQWLIPQTNPPKQQVVAIVGVGGLGKTQLSLAYVRRAVSTYSSVFWLNAATEASLKQSMVDMALEVSGEDDPGALDTDQQVDHARKWLSEPENNRWLLILDNYDDPKLPGIASATGYDIRDFFPKRAHGSILITTRSGGLSFAKQLRLQRIEDLNQSLEILSKRSGRNITEDPDSKRLVLRLDGLPLALATVGTYFSQSSESCAEYLEAYDKEWGDLKEDASPLYEYEDRTLFTTWNMSREKVSAQDKDAATLLSFLGYFDNRDIWYELVKAAASDKLPWLQRVTSTKRKFERAMSRLTDYCLVESTFQILRSMSGTTSAGSRSYSIHAVVHDWMLFELNNPINKNYLGAVLYGIGSQVKREWQDNYWSTNRRLVSHARRIEHPALWEMLENEELETDDWDMVHAIANMWRAESDYETSERLLRLSLKGLEQSQGEEGYSTLNVALNLGGLYADLEKLDIGEELYMRALVGFEKTLGPESVEALDTKYSLGLLYQVQCDPEKSMDMLKKTLAGYEKVLGPDEISTLDTVNLMGSVYVDLKQYDEAEKMYKRALTGFEKALGPNHASTMLIVQNLGLFEHIQGRYDNAEQWLQRAHQGYTKTLGPRHLSTMRAADFLGELYAAQDLVDKACELLPDVVEVYEKVLGMEHSWTYRPTSILGHLHLVQKDFDQAEPLLLKAYEGRKAIMPDDPSTWDSYLDLGRLRGWQGRAEEAKDIFEHVVHKYSEICPDDNQRMTDAGDCLQWADDKLSGKNAVNNEKWAGVLPSDPIHDEATTKNTLDTIREQLETSKLEDLFKTVDLEYKKAVDKELVGGYEDENEDENEDIRTLANLAVPKSLRIVSDQDPGSPMHLNGPEIRPLPLILNT